MWKNYLLVALRNLSRHRLYSIINIVGLAIGLGGCLLIAGYVANELSFESSHVKRDRIYRIATLYQSGETTIPMASTFGPMAAALIEEFPEVEATARIRYVKETKIVAVNEVISGNRVLYATPDIFNVFTLPLEGPQTRSALQEPNTILISPDLAHRCFGSDSPIGKTIKVDNAECRVAGVLGKIPANTQLRCDAIVSFATLDGMGGKGDSWDRLWQDKDQVYILLRPGHDPQEVMDKLPALAGRHLSSEEAKAFTFRLQPLKRIYLHSRLNFELEPQGNLTYVYIFSCIAVLLLILASINFVNLATARTARRIKEVAVRKVFGAYRTDLICQFIGESVCLTAVSMLLGIALFEIAKPQLEAFIGRELPIGLISSPLLCLVMMVMIVAVGVIAGSYPAFYLSRFRPADAMRKDSTRTTSRSGLRRALVVIQFSTAIGLTIAAFAIYRQTDLFRIKDLGFRHDNVLILDLSDDKISNKCQLLRDEIAKMNRAESVCALWSPPGSGWLALQTLANPSRPDQQPNMTPIMWVDKDFISTFGIKLLEGRGFSDQSASDQQNSIIINKTAVTEFGFTNPVGQTLLEVDSKRAYTIVGVVDDFHAGSLREKITSRVMIMDPSQFQHVAVKLPSSDVEGTIAAITEIWKNIIPDHPIKYRLLDDILAEGYERERKTGSLFVVFSILAAFIGGLGVFGLASFAAECRTKEIGIRKALGASVPSVVRMLVREFVFLVVLAHLVAAPITYYAVKRWLQGFAYRIDLGPDMFIYAGLMALAIALLTVGFQALRAARANPVESLKYE